MDRMLTCKSYHNDLHRQWSYLLKIFPPTVIRTLFLVVQSGQKISDRLSSGQNVRKIEIQLDGRNYLIFMCNACVWVCMCVCVKQILCILADLELHCFMNSNRDHNSQQKNVAPGNRRWHMVWSEATSFTFVWHRYK